MVLTRTGAVGHPNLFGHRQILGPVWSMRCLRPAALLRLQTSAGNSCSSRLLQLRYVPSGGEGRLAGVSSSSGTGLPPCASSAKGKPLINWDYTAQACIVCLGKLQQPDTLALAADKVSGSKAAAASTPGALQWRSVPFTSVLAHPQLRKLLLTASTACQAFIRSAPEASKRPYFTAVLAASRNQLKQLGASAGVKCLEKIHFRLDACAPGAAAQGGHVYALGGSTLCAMIATNEKEVALGIQWLRESLTAGDNWVALDTEHAENRLSVVQLATSSRCLIIRAFRPEQEPRIDWTSGHSKLICKFLSQEDIILLAQGWSVDLRHLSLHKLIDPAKPPARVLDLPVISLKLGYEKRDLKSLGQRLLSENFSKSSPGEWCSAETLTPRHIRYAALDVFAVQYIMRTLPLKHGVKAFEAAANMQGCLESHPVGAYERSQPKAQSPTKKVKLAAAAAGLCSFGVLLWPWATGLCVMSHQ